MKSEGKGKNYTKFNALFLVISEMSSGFAWVALFKWIQNTEFLSSVSQVLYVIGFSASAASFAITILCTPSITITCHFLNSGVSTGFPTRASWKRARVNIV
ncbi:MAG: hypothetical protein WAW59_08370 [Patescibacteria group bacterium]